MISNNLTQPFIIRLTILVLIVESHWTETNNPRKRVFPVEQNSTCWEREKYEVVNECQACTGKLHCSIFVECRILKVEF